MSNVAVLQPQRSIRDYSPAQLSLIRQTVAKDTTPTEFDMFVTVCRSVGLDPFRKQIYCAVYNKDDAEKRKCVFITGIDGFRAVAARNRDYRPDDQEPEIVTDPDLKGTSNPLGIVKATVRVYKYGPDGKWYPCVGVAHWSEFAPMKQGNVEWVKTGEVYPVGHKKAGKDKYRPVQKDGAEPVPDGKWATMPHVMLAKCAEAQALRKGWPEDLSGIYAPEEMDQAMVDITPSAEIEQHEQQKRLQLVGATRAIPILWKVGEPIQYVPVGKLGDEAAKYIKDSDMPAELKWWWETNTAGFREFWAISKSDALGVRQLYEARLKTLEGQ
jgi:phage recombination protein Bet